MDRSKVMAPKRLWLVNALGNALLLAAVYWWLAIPERRTWQIALSVVLGMVIVAGAVWLYTATFRAFASTGEGLGKGVAARVPAVLVCVLIGLGLLGLVAWMAAYFPSAANWTASTLSYRLRTPVRPGSVLRVFNAIGWVLSWIVLPALVIPRAGAAAIDGFRGVRAARPRRRFYVDYLAAFFAGVWLPSLLVNWVPGFEGFVAQAISFLARFALAWILGVTAWLWLAWASVRAVENGDTGV